MTTLTQTNRWIGNDPELHHYAMRKDTIRRRALNTMGTVGLFIFSWLIVVALSRLNRKGLAWALWIPAAILFQISMRADDPEIKGFTVVIALCLYIGAWVVAN